jgi:hypothetical protein
LISPAGLHHQCLAAALKAGINFFDTAEMYGDGYSEEVRECQLLLALLLLLLLLLALLLVLLLSVILLVLLLSLSLPLPLRHCHCC